MFWLFLALTTLIALLYVAEIFVLIFMKDKYLGIPWPKVLGSDEMTEVGFRDRMFFSYPFLIFVFGLMTYLLGHAD